MSKPEIDQVTGVETTGHEWDGVKELNKPLPRWWVLTFYATIVWAIGYWIVYPAWPTLRRLHARACWATVSARWWRARSTRRKAAQAQFRDKLAATPLDQVKSDPDLLRFAIAGGAAAFQTNCAPCHGRGAQGFAGYPNLNDDDWLWGGSIDDIHKTIGSGIRSDQKETRASQMPRYGIDKLLDDKQISDAAEYVLSLSGRAGDQAAVARGQAIFAEQCASCHGTGRQGQAGAGRSQPDRRHLALRRQPAGDRGKHQDRARRHDARLDRPAGSRDAEVAGRLRPHPRRREVGRGGI